MHLTLHLTDRCNMACRYCYASHGQTDMTFETATAAIRRCAEGPNCGIIFFGGEPLLRSDLIWDVIRWCEREEPHRFHYKVTTNGLLLEEPFLAAAEQHRLHVALSHDGVKATHDRFRLSADGAETFDRLLPKLQMLLARQPYAPVMTTVNPETVATMADSVRWLQGAGVQYIVVSLNYAGQWTDARLRQLKREYLKLEKWHLENYRAERKLYFSPFDTRMSTHIFGGRGVSCRLGRRQISVGPDGTLYPCVQFLRRTGYAIGTAGTGIDETRRETIFRANEAEKESCAGCALNGRCHNKCGCLNIQTTGSLSEVPPVLCEHERMVFPIADRLANRLYKERNALFIQRHYNPAFPVLSFLEDLAQV